jgi:serine/threonine-protein kinase
VIASILTVEGEDEVVVATPFGRYRAGLIVAGAVAAAVLGAGLVTFGLRQSDPSTSRIPTAQPSTTQPPATTAPITLVEESALDGLLVSPADINTAMGTDLQFDHNTTTMEDNSAVNPDPACRPISGVLTAQAYSRGGWIAFREQVFQRGEAPSRTHYVDQGVVLYSSPRDAEALFTASAQRWPACSNRTFVTHDTENWAVGRVSNADGMLSVTRTNRDYTCWRAMTVAKNVVVDVQACGKATSQPSAAINIARQIAAKVLAT